jgi:O-antigen/teichoic acid export membrane protein
MLINAKLLFKIYNNKEFWALLEKFLKAISMFFLIFVVAKNVDSNDFGYYILLEVLLSVGVVISIAGTDLTANKTISDIGKEKATILIFRYRLIFSIFSCLILLLFIVLSGTYSLSSPLIIGLLFFILSPFAMTEQLYYDEGNYIDIYKVKIIFIFISILLRGGAINSEYFLELMVVSFFCEILSPAYLFFKKKMFNNLRGIWLSFYDYKMQFKHCVPVLLASLSIIAYSKIDQFMIGAMLNYGELAKYSIVVKISDSFVFLPAVIGALYLPKAYKTNFTDDFIANYFRLLFILSLISISASLLIYCVFMVVVGEELAVTWKGYFIYQLVIILNFSGVAISQFQIYSGRSLSRLIRVVVGLVLNLFLNFLLIPVYGINGAIFSTVFSLFISNILLVYFTSERHYLNRLLFSIISFSQFKFSGIR